MYRIYMSNTWYETPAWWQAFVSQIRSEAPPGTDAGGHLDWYLQDKYRANLDGYGVVFESEDDYLVFKITWMN